MEHDYYQRILNEDQKEINKFNKYKDQANAILLRASQVGTELLVEKDNIEKSIFNQEEMVKTYKQLLSEINYLKLENNQNKKRLNEL
mmetsp:Transcript_6697/g.5970  ORF Transcript_6697/g.5970 Transcript_6697/m.5970 type:complete len:87 (+) Transcript_6697:210-470(+)